VTTEPAATPAPFGTGDTVAWQASRMHGAGTGMVVRVLPPVNGGRHRYEALKLIFGLSTHEYVLLEEDEVYRTRSIRDIRPWGHATLSRRAAAPHTALLH
jgi:hypothetical protein